MKFLSKILFHTLEYFQCTLIKRGMLIIFYILLDKSERLVSQNIAIRQNYNSLNILFQVHNFKIELKISCFRNFNLFMQNHNILIFNVIFIIKYKINCMSLTLPPPLHILNEYIFYNIYNLSFFFLTQQLQKLC